MQNQVENLRLLSFSSRKKEKLSRKCNHIGRNFEPWNGVRFAILSLKQAWWPILFIPFFKTVLVQSFQKILTTFISEIKWLKGLLKTTP